MNAHPALQLYIVQYKLRNLLLPQHAYPPFPSRPTSICKLVDTMSLLQLTVCVIEIKPGASHFSTFGGNASFFLWLLREYLYICLSFICLASIRKLRIIHPASWAMLQLHEGRNAWTHFFLKKKWWTYFYKIKASASIFVLYYQWSHAVSWNFLTYHIVISWSFSFEPRTK